MREGKENKKHKQKQGGRERSWSSLCINNGNNLEVILNTLNETPFTPTVIVAGGECKAFICRNLGWLLVETAKPWPKPETFFSFLPTKDHLKQNSELCPFYLKVFRRQELRNAELYSLFEHMMMAMANELPGNVLHILLRNTSLSKFFTRLSFIIIFQTGYWSNENIELLTACLNLQASWLLYWGIFT